MTSLVVVSAGLSIPSSTRLLADRLTQAVGQRTRATMSTIELRELAHALATSVAIYVAPPRTLAPDHIEGIANGGIS